MTEEAAVEINVSPEAMQAQINSQAGQIVNLQLIQQELVLQIRAKDAEILELKKARPTKRTTAKKKASG